MIKHTKNKQENLESGQVIVIMAFVIIVLLGMLGLAIDGGGLFFLWRDAQNATDAAVLNAAYAQCLDGEEDAVIAAGKTAAAYNGFEDDNFDDWVTIDVDDSTQLITATIRATKPAYFIQVLGFPKILEISNEAQAFCIPKFDPFTVPAMYATGDCPNGISWSGARGTFIGGAFATDINFQSATLVKRGNLQWMTGFSANTATWGLNDDGSTTTDEQLSERPKQTVEIDVTRYAPKGEIYERLEANGGYVHYITANPQISGETASAGSEDISPSGWWKPDDGEELRGLYYVEAMVDISNKVDWHPEGATIVSTGTLKFNSDQDSGPYSYYGRNDASGLINTEGVFLASLVNGGCGAAELQYSGTTSTVYGFLWAPNAGIRFSGSDHTIIGGLVAQQVDIQAADLYYEYDPSLLPPRPPKTGFAG